MKTQLVVRVLIAIQFAAIVLLLWTLYEKGQVIGAKEVSSNSTNFRTYLENLRSIAVNKNPKMQILLTLQSGEDKPKTFTVGFVRQEPTIQTTISEIGDDYFCLRFTASYVCAPYSSVINIVYGASETANH